MVGSLTTICHCCPLQAAKERANSLELQVNRLHQQVSAVDATNSRLTQGNSRLQQQLSDADASLAMLHSEMSALQSSRQQLEATCEQLRALQQEGQRNTAQLRDEVAQTSQQAMVRGCLLQPGGQNARGTLSHTHSCCCMLH